MTTYQTNIDIANRAAQHLGQTSILAFTDNSRQAKELSLCYDKLRTAELEKQPWRFATRRAYLWPYTTTTLRLIAAAWAASVAFTVGQIVQDTNGTYWSCVFAHTSSATNSPGLAITGSPAYWQQYFGPVVCDLYSATATYNAGDLVYTGSGPYTVYVSLTNGNLNNTPSGGAPWSNIQASGASTVLPVSFILPAGPGLSVNTVARNIFPLPNGFLRVTASDPKQPNVAFLAASGAQRMQDWQLESNFIVSGSAKPLLVRFVADISDVLSMTPLFCELLAASCSRETCEALTQSEEKFKRIAAAYTDLFVMAETVNNLQTGTTEVQDGAMTDNSQESKFPNAGPNPPQQRGQ